MTKISRRTFAVAAVTGFSAFSTPSLARSAIEMLRVGVIGVGVRGKNLIGNLPPEARVTAICDCSSSRIASVLAPSEEFRTTLGPFTDRDAKSCQTYRDYRQLLDRERLDAVIIATPDHHHVPAAITALENGLHVYVEKPLTVCVRDGRWLADTVRRTGRVLQVGSQQRTMEANRIACEFVRGGGLGKISRVELPNYPGPLADLALEPEAIPADLDWNLFCGPAPLRPYHRRLWIKDEFKVGELLWRGWDLFRDYSGHMMTNWGAHSVDLVQWALGRDDTGPIDMTATRPESIEPIAAAWKTKSPLPLGLDERRFWPVTMRYADGIELRFATEQEFVVFHGERGRLRMRRNYFDTDPQGLVKEVPDPAAVARWQGTGHVARPHLENWIAAIKGADKLHAPVEAGHRTATICHLANIAREVNRPLRWDPAREQFLEDPEANQLLDRPRRKEFVISR